MYSLNKSHNSNNHYPLTPPSPQVSEDFLLPPIRLKTLSKSNPNLKTKVNLLKELCLGRKSYSPNSKQTIKAQAISIADFTGDKKSFFKKIGFWEAYKKFQNLEKDTKYHSEKSLSKPDKPYLMDLNTERKLAFAKYKVNPLSSRLSRIISPQYSKPNTQNISLPMSPQHNIKKLNIEITEPNEDLEEIKSCLTLPVRASRSSLQLSPRNLQFNNHCHRNSAVLS